MPGESLERRLQANGCTLPLDQFQDQIVDVMSQNYLSWSVDELVLHPDDAKRFCQLVRAATNAHDLPDDLVLRCLMDRRKNPGR